MAPRIRWRSDRGWYELVDGQKRQKLGPTEADRERGEKIAARVTEKVQLATRSARPRAATEPLPIDALLLEWHAAHTPTFSRGYEELADGQIRNHLTPYFADRDLRTLTEHDVLPYATHIVVEKKLSTAVAQHGLSILRKLCAIHARALGGVNPLLGFDRVLASMKAREAKRATERDAWTLEELAGILELAREHEPWLYAPAVHASHTGARLGETLGQLWTGIDFARGQVRITGKLRHREDEVVKERRTRGAKAIPMWVCGPLLRETLEELAEKRAIREPWREPTLLFFERDGKTPIDPSGAFRRAWNRLRARMVERKIRPLVWHCFRHTFVSHALEAGHAAKRVGEWVGHGSTYITEHYAHALPQSEEGRGFMATPKARPLEVAG